MLLLPPLLPVCFTHPPGLVFQTKLPGARTGIHCTPFQQKAAGPLVNSGLHTPLQNKVNQKQVQITGPVQSFQTFSIKNVILNFPRRIYTGCVLMTLGNILSWYRFVKLQADNRVSCCLLRGWLIAPCLEKSAFLFNCKTHLLKSHDTSWSQCNSGLGTWVAQSI